MKKSPNPEWESEVREALAKIDENPSDYKSEYTVGNILIRANVFGGCLDPMFGAGCYTIPLYRLMYKDENHWFGNVSSHDGVVEAIKEYTGKRVYDGT